MLTKQFAQQAFDVSPRILKLMPYLDDFTAALPNRLANSDGLFDHALSAVLPLKRIGYNTNNVATLLTHIERLELSRGLNQAKDQGTDLVLNCPIHFAVTAPQFHILCFPENHHKPWRRLLNAKNLAETSDSADGYLLKSPSNEMTILERYNWIKRELRRSFSRAYKRYRKSTGLPLPKRLTLNDYTRALANQAMLKLDIQPAIITLRQTSPLPVDASPDSYPLLKGITLAPITIKGWETFDSLKQLPAKSLTEERLRGYIEERKNDHRGLYQEVIARIEKRENPARVIPKPESLSASIFSSNSPADCPKGYTDTCKAVIEEYFEILFKYKKEAKLSKSQANLFLIDALNFLWGQEWRIHPYSLTLLSLAWVTERVCELQINPKTAQKYISQLTKRTGIYFSMAHDLRLWNDVDLEMFINFIDNRLQGAQSTKQSRSVQTLLFFRFCGSLGLLKGVGIPVLQNGYITSRKRNQLISHARINDLINNTGEPSSEINRTTVLGTALTFYGGLRHDEFARLHLSHLNRYNALYQEGEFGEGPIEKLRVKITHGKTDNAPRSVYLHLFVPETVQVKLLHAVDTRRALFPTAYLKNIRLSGNNNDRLGHRSGGLSATLLDELKKWFGDSIDVHTLRHCYVTWLILAYYTARHPKLTDFYNVPRGTPLFEDEGLNALMTFINAHAIDASHNDQSHHFAVLAQMVGHGDIQTTFQHYFHAHSVLTRYHLHQL